MGPRNTALPTRPDPLRPRGRSRAGRSTWPAPPVARRSGRRLQQPARKPSAPSAASRSSSPSRLPKPKRLPPRFPQRRPGRRRRKRSAPACPACGKTLKAPASAAGKKAKCPACNAVMVVPEKILDAEELATSQAMGGTPLPIGFPQPSGVEYPQTPVTGIPQVSAIGSPQMPALGAPQVPGVGFPQPAPSIYNDDDFSPAGSPTYGVTASAPTSAEPGALPVRNAAN